MSSSESDNEFSWGTSSEMDKPKREKYRKYFEHGPPEVEIVMNSDDFMPMLAPMDRSTHGLIAPETLCFAVWKGDRAKRTLLEAYEEATFADDVDFKFEDIQV